MSRRRKSQIDFEAVSARAGGMCEAWVPGVCVMQLEHHHHRKLRSGGGKDDTANILATCHACHDWIHRNVADATAQGWIVSRYVDDPASVPVSRWGHMTLLDDDGTVTLAML